MNIRTAWPADAGQTAALLSAVWVATYATEGVTPEIAAYVLAEFTEERVAESLRRPGRYAWIAKEGHGVIGYADLQLDQGTPHLGPVRQAEVLRLYVNEHHVRRGVGSRLLETCAEHAFAHGCEAVWLSVWDRNDRAVRFYDSRGWECCGITTFRLGGVDHPNRVYAWRKPRGA